MLMSLQPTPEQSTINGNPTPSLSLSSEQKVFAQMAQSWKTVVPHNPAA